MSAPSNDAAPPGNGAGANNKSAENDSPAFQMQEFFETLWMPDTVVEIRAPKCSDRADGKYPHTCSGYFQRSHLSEMIKAIAALDDAGRAPGIYFTLNPVAPALLARSPNAIAPNATETASDADVVRRVTLLIDCDPVRPSGISSTDAELQAAVAKATVVRDHLQSLGWPEPLQLMSGNGAHLLFRIDLPTDDGGLVKRVLAALSHRFSDAAVKIDESVFNPARISKIAGTMARKGKSLVGIEGVEDRPHRRSSIISKPDNLEVVSRELLESLAATAPEPAPKGGTKPGKSKEKKAESKSADEHAASGAGARESKSTFERFEHTVEGVRDYLERHGLAVSGTKPTDGGTFLFLDRCPVVPDCPSTAGSDIAVFVGVSGELGYKNMHDRGEGLCWTDVREALEPGYRAYAEQQAKKAEGSNWRQIGDVKLVAVGTLTDGRLVVSAVDGNERELARDNVNPNSSRSRAWFIDAVAETRQLEEHERRDMDMALRELTAPPFQPTAGATTTSTDWLADRDAVSAEKLSEMPEDVRAEAEALLLDPRLVDRVLEDIERCGVVGEEALALTVYVIGASRLLRAPLAGITQGTSSSGKSFVIETVAGCFPKEWVLRATDLTPNALYYFTPGGLMHTFVVAGERSRQHADEAAETKRALREMLASGELVKVVTVSVPGGGFTTESVYQPGPIAFIESTTHTNLFDEDANRCLLLSTDESPEQTARVIHAAAAAARGLRPDAERTRLVHQAAQRMLKRVEVRVPFADALAAAMPKTRPDARRAFRATIGVIRAVAILHQRQRSAGELKHGDTIEASVHDYAVARRLLIGPLARAIGGSLPDAVARFAQRLSARFGTETFSSTDAVKEDGIITSKGKANQYLRTLAEFGVVESVGEAKGSQPKTWKFVGEIPKGGEVWLPSPQALQGDPS